MVMLLEYLMCCAFRNQFESEIFLSKYVWIRPLVTVSVKAEEMRNTSMPQLILCAAIGTRIAAVMVRRSLNIQILNSSRLLVYISFIPLGKEVLVIVWQENKMPLPYRITIFIEKCHGYTGESFMSCADMEKNEAWDTTSRTLFKKCSCAPPYVCVLLWVIRNIRTRDSCLICRIIWWCYLWLTHVNGC